LNRRGWIQLDFSKMFICTVGYLLFQQKGLLFELNFEGKFFYCGLPAPAIRRSRSPVGLQQAAIVSRSFICMLYIRIIDGNSLKFNPLSSRQ
jgi:hypothetical protein